MSESATPTADRPPDLSLVMPCYNEEDVVGFTIPRLFEAFEEAGYVLEIIGVDNGSSDRTLELLQELGERYPRLVAHRISPNIGYGNGVLNGFPLCTATLVGIIPADGEVDAVDVVRLYEAVSVSSTPTLGKVRRRFRMDGLRRKVISTGYNLFVRALWPGMSSLDMNGSPKILPRAAVEQMELRSTDWFLDPEIMVKAHHMGLRILEFNVFARMRGNGISHVRMTTAWEFFTNLLSFRFSGELPDWASRRERLGPGGGPVARERSS